MGLQDGRSPCFVDIYDFSFVLCVAQRSGLFHQYPNLTPRLLEIIFRKSFMGVSIGYELPRGTEPAGPRGWALLPFDNGIKAARARAQVWSGEWRNNVQHGFVFNMVVVVEVVGVVEVVVTVGRWRQQGWLVVVLVVAGSVGSCGRSDGWWC
jgi:hypothetical protein